MVRQARSLFVGLYFAVAIVVSGVVVQADPCGMVPPILPGPTIPLVRVGDQHTYVFYKDGIESVVIRPGFKGEVEEFGMLIPFPTPPAIRKVSDDIFPHIAAAIDPPEVVADFLIRRRFLARTAASAPTSEAIDRLELNKVRVISQEAVGMYEVAVLEAGSPRALNRWMDDHNYKYPKGMDGACQDYVNDRWCFVAVKTRVGQKDGVNPQPGQTNVNDRLPKGAGFTGHVQAMGFRFKTDQMVVPMRLSTFNGGDLHNVAYILTDQPCRIDDIPTSFVKRQITGEQLLQNVTQLLPLRVLGRANITKEIARQYDNQRDPEPKNGAAKELFASDLMSVSSGELALAHEEREKALLSISESLGLRGSEIDKVHAQSLTKERKKTIDDTIQQIKSYTLTVVDGDFPREVIANKNLTFSNFKMSVADNTAEKYDAKQKGPAPKMQGEIYLGSSEAFERQNNNRGTTFFIGAGLFSLGMVGVVVPPRSRRITVAGILIVFVGLTFVPTSIAEEAALSDLSQDYLVKQFDDARNAEAAAKELVSRGDEALELLLDAAVNGSSLEQKGWAISCLGRIGGPQVESLLAKIHHDSSADPLLKTWAAAARIEMTDSFELLVEKASLVQSYPALARPLSKKLLAKMRDGDESISVESLIGLTRRLPSLQTSLTQPILDFGAKPLIQVMSSCQDQDIRRQATAYLGTLFTSGDGSIPQQVIDAYQFDSKAKKLPWAGGPLFLPGISWDQEQARELVGNLIRWHLWCDRQGLSQEQRPIHNNLRSLALARAAGYQSPGFGPVDTIEWLKVWSKVVGRSGIENILRDQGELQSPRYRPALKS